MAESIPATWTPTPDNVNALSPPLRQYIHNLETRCDPAGDVRDLIILQDRARDLETLLARESKVLAEARELLAESAAQLRKYQPDYENPATQIPADVVGNLRERIAAFRKRMKDEPS